MLIVGHRGAKGLAPENTLASLKEVLKYKVDAIEVDVRVTLDNIPVLFHDEYFSTRGGKNLVIAHTDFDVLKKHRPDLITLDEAINAVDRRVPLWIEVKPGTPVIPVVDVIDRKLDGKWHLSDFQFLSYDFAVLKQLQKHYPEAGLIVNEKWSGVRASYKARRLGTKQIDLNAYVVWRGFVRALARRGWKLYVYRQNNVRQARRWEKAGLAGIITQYPDRFQG